MSLNRYGPAVILCALLLGACGQDNQESRDDAEDDEATPIPVEIGTPIRGDILAVYAGTAPIEALAEADVIAKVSGEVREILVEEGDIVSQGEILARLDGDKLTLELDQSKANLRKLQRDYERNIELKDKGLISTGEFDKIKYEMEALDASFNLARLELDYTKIRAPIAGVISERFVKIGNWISVGEATFRVTSFDPLVVYLHVPEREYRRIAKGQPVTIEIDALQSQKVLATVTRISPTVDPETGTFKITIEISAGARRIKPGMFGRISIVYDTHENALQIPRSAILEENGRKSVFVIEDNKAVRRMVQTDYSQSGMVEVVDGLSDGDRVVTTGQNGLKEDAIVLVINESDDAPETQLQIKEEVSEDAPTN